MSGHSKWAGIKHKKAVVDAKRGKVFTKLIREITVVAREGGGDVSSSARLRTIIGKAKEANMPQGNIEKAIKRGTGELPGVSYEEITYEGYGPKGVAILVDALTDNKNRTTAEVRSIFDKRGGNLAGTGSVKWIFEAKGLVIVDRDKIDEDKLLGIVLDAGAENMTTGDDSYEITTDVKSFEQVKSALKEGGVEWRVAELTMMPSNTVQLEGDAAKKVLDLVNSLEDQDDVQNVYANFDIPDEVLKANAT